MTRWGASVGLRVLASITAVGGFWVLFVWGISSWANSETFDTLGYLWWQLILLAVFGIGSLALLVASRSRAAWLHYLYGMAAPAFALYFVNTFVSRTEEWIVLVLWGFLVLIPLPGTVWKRSAEVVAKSGG